MEYETQYPQPVNLSQSAYDMPVPRSIQSDLDFIESQSNRIVYLDSRIVRLEQLLRNKEYASKVSETYISELEKNCKTFSDTIDSRDRHIIKLENELDYMRSKNT